MDGFQDTYWNLIQTLAWVYLGDRALVRRASDGVTDHGTFSQQVWPLDGRKDWTETTAEAPGPVELEATAAHRGGAAYPSLDDAEDGVLAAARDCRLPVWGLENGEGDLKAILRIQWADLKFYFGPSRAGPREYLRPGATE